MRGVGRRRLALCLGNPRCRDEGGFSLAETLVALGIAVVSLLAMLGTGIFALRSSVEGRLNQLAGSLVNGAVEQVRSLEYRNVAMRQTDLTATTDSAVNKTVTPHTFNPGTGAERLWTEGTGLVHPYVRQDISSRGRFTIRRYVTVPVTCTSPATVTPCAAYNGSLPSIKRLTVVVRWQHFGKAHERRVGTLITNTRRGLPLPDYNWDYHGPATITPAGPSWAKNPGNAVDYGFVLVNKGAEESWKLTTDPASPAWEWYRDSNQNGLYDAGEPSLGTAATGYVTGPIPAGAPPFYVVATRTVALTDLGASSTTFTATSVKFPTHPSRSVIAQMVVTAGVVVVPSATATPSTPSVACNPGAAPTTAAAGARPVATTQQQYTITDLSLYNGPTAGDTPTQTSNAMGTDPGLLQPNPCNFSTDVGSNRPGRRLVSTASAQWLFQPGSAAQDEFRGTAVLSIWVQCPSGSPTPTPTLTVQLGSYSTTSTTFTSQSSSSVSATACAATPGTFHRVDFSLSIPGAGFSVPAGGVSRLGIRVSTNSPVDLLYGVNQMPAKLTVGIK